MFKPKPRKTGSGEIRKLGDLFEKYKKTLVAPQATVVDTFVEVVKELLDFEVNKEQVSYSPASRILSIRGGGPLKSEIKMNEVEILVHVKGRLGDKSCPEKIT